MFRAQCAGNGRLGARILERREKYRLARRDSQSSRLYGLPRRGRDSQRGRDRGGGIQDVYEWSRGVRGSVRGRQRHKRHVSARSKRRHVILLRRHAVDDRPHGRARSALTVIADTKRASFVQLPDGQERTADRQCRPEVDCVSEALPLSEFYRTLTGSADRRLTSAEDRAALLGAAKPLLLSMAPGAMRLQLVRELADAARTPHDAVEALYGLRKAPRLRIASAERHTPRVEVSDLKLAYCNSCSPIRCSPASSIRM